MQNKLLAFLREQQMLQAGDRVICAVSGGADSVALLFAMYLLRQQLGIQVEAAHFNHHLRGDESDRDEAFVRSFCQDYDIQLHVGGETVVAGEKGLEAAARDARYAFLKSLPGKIATAHTADDNAETVLMHLIRGTGLQGLGGIRPMQGQLIRPMLRITRQEVLTFLEQWNLPHVEDSSNGSDAFLRNRIRHHVMPLLYQENPRLAENLSRMAMGLGEDAAYLASLAERETLPGVEQLQSLPPSLRSRMLAQFLRRSGVAEPEQTHIDLVQGLLQSKKPSAWACLPGGVVIRREYNRLTAQMPQPLLQEIRLTCPGKVNLPGLQIRCEPAQALVNTATSFTVCPKGALYLRSRRTGDTIRLPGGSKSLKKLMIDRKIPAADRDSIPVLCDDGGILGVWSIGANQDRVAKQLPGVTISFVPV